MTTTTATQTEITEAIRTAYWAIRAARQDEISEFVGLAELRPALKAYTRGQVDAGLVNLALNQKGFHLIPIANLKSLTLADRAAALEMGGENQNAFMIEGAAPIARTVQYAGRHRGPQGR